MSHDVGGTAADVAFAYGYNPAGQIVTQVRNNDLYAHAFGSTATQTSVIDGLNRLATLDTVNLTYDANSNITNDTARTFTYDLLSRLTGTGSSSLEYDALGRLSRMVGTAGARYLYDGIEITGVATSGSTIGNHFVRGPWPDEMIIAYPGGSFAAPQWSLQDHQGSVIAVTDASGAATAVNTYDEYGVPGSSNSGRMQYTGQLWLPDFGLYHYKARAYHPGIGRFMQTDPIGYAAGANLYVYVGGDPVNFTDPLGLQVNCEDDPTCTDIGPLPPVIGRRCNGIWVNDVCFDDIDWLIPEPGEQFWRVDGITATPIVAYTPIQIVCPSGIYGGATFNRDVFDGADRAAHTHPFWANVTPTYGDRIITRELGIPLLGITRRGVWEISRSGGDFSIRVIQGNFTRGELAQMRAMERRYERDYMNRQRNPGRRTTRQEVCG